MARVFISFASADLALAEELRRALTENGHQVFLDRHREDGIRAGEDWKQRLYERLRWSDAVICPVTPAYAASTWCFAEIAVAQTLGRPVLPLAVGARVRHTLLDALQHLAYEADHARLLAELRRLDAGGGAGWPDDRSPFPGLLPFDAGLHQAFFGRGEDVKGLAGLLRSTVERAAARMLLVVGPSGCGKSSLVRAGLAPTMAREPEWWVLPPLTPAGSGGDTADPLRELARILAKEGHRLGLEWTVAEMLSWLDGAGGLTRVAEELLVAAPGRPARLLLVVDQFEELVTRTAAGRRASFARVLAEAMAGPVSVVATLRPEFLAQVQSDPQLAEVPVRLVELRPLDRHALATVIEQPARLAGIGIEPGLVDRLVADTGTGEALPLLAFTLEQLARGVARGGQLSLDRYRELGGVQGALVGRADEALSAAMENGDRSRGEVIASLLRLVTVDEQGRPTGWRVGWTELSDAARADLGEFVRRRLLVTTADDGAVQVAVAHEAVLSAWAPLAEAVGEAAAALRMRRAVELAADEWDRAGRPSLRLWEGAQLARAVAAGTLPTVNSAAFAPDGRTLATAADDGSVILWDITDRPRYRRIGAFLTGLDWVGALAFAPDARTLVVIGNVGGLSMGSDEMTIWDVRDRERPHRVGRPFIEIIGGAQALVFAPRGPTLAVIGRKVTLLDLSDRGRPRLLSDALVGPADSKETVLAAAFTADGRTLATGNSNSTVDLWDVADPSRPRRLGQPLTGHQTALFNEGVLSVAFAPDGKTLATGGRDDTAIVYDVTDRARPRLIGQPLTDHTNAVSSVRFASDGKTLATGSDDNSVILWDMTNRDRPLRIGRPLVAQTAGLRDVEFSPDGTLLATVANDRTVALWDLTRPGQPRRLGDPLPRHGRFAYSLLIASSGGVMAVVSDTVQLWDMADRERPRRVDQPFEGGGLPGDDAAFTPDGRTLATGDKDGIHLWDVSNVDQIRPVGSPFRVTDQRAVSQLAFGSGTVLAVASGNGVSLWDVADRERPRQLARLPISEVGTVAFAPDGRTIAVASGGQVVLWDLKDLERPRKLDQTLGGHLGGPDSIAFSPDGHTLATGSRDNTVIVWDLTDREHPRRLGRPLTDHIYSVTSVAFSPDGRTLASASFDATAMLWDMSDRERPRRLGEPLVGHASGLSAAAFSPDGRTLVTASYFDPTVVLWDLTVMNAIRDRAVENACALAGGGLTQEEWARHVPSLPYQQTCP